MAKEQLLNEKSQLDRFFDRVNRWVPVLNQQLEQAQAAGDTNLATTLSNEILAIKREADRKSQRYADLDFEISGQMRSGASERLSSGLPSEEAMVSPATISMGGSMPAFSPARFDPSRVAEEKKRDLAYVSGIAPENIDLSPEDVPAGQRFAMGALQTSESRAKYIQGKYKGQGVYPVNIDGRDEFLVVRPNGTAFTTEDKSFAGTAGAIAVEAPIIVGETAAFLGTLATTKSPALSYAAAAGTRTAMGSVIDSGLEQVLGIAPFSENYFKAITRRGTEAVVGSLIGGVADVAGSKFLANRISPKFTNQFAEQLEQSAARLAKREKASAAAVGREAGEVYAPIGARIGGPLGLESQQYLAGARPNSGFAGSMKRTQDTLRELWDSYVSKTPTRVSAYKTAAKQQFDNRQKLAEEVAKRANLSVNAVRQNLDNKLTRYSNLAANEDKLGKVVGDVVREAEQAEVLIKNETFDKAFDFADSVGASLNPQELLDFAVQTRIRESQRGAFDNTAVKSVEKRLERRANAQELLSKATNRLLKLSREGKEIPRSLEKEIDELRGMTGPIDAREFDYWIRAFNDARPENAVGSATRDQLGAAVSKNMSAYRRDFYSKFDGPLPDGASANLGSLYDNAVNQYQQRMEFEVNLLGKVLREEGGEFKMFPREIVSAVMREPAKVRNVMDAVSRYEAQNPYRNGITASIRDMMQQKYLYDLGFGKPGVNISSIKYDRGMMQELWGGSADRMMLSLDELNKTLSKTGLGKNLSYDDIRMLGSTLDDASRKKAIKQIYLRLDAERNLESLQNSEIYKLAQKGDFASIDPDMFARFLLSDGTTTSQAEKALLQLGKLDPASRNAFKGDFARELLNSFPGGNHPAGLPNTPMFDTEAAVKAMDAPIGTSNLRRKMELALGKGDAEFLYDLAKVNNANQIRIANQGEPLRMTAGLAGVSLYLAHGVTGGVRNSLMAAMLSASTPEKKMLNKAISAMAAGTGSSGQIDAAYKNMLGSMFTTRNGLMALARQAQNDEEFSMYLSQMANKFRDDQEELDKIMGEE
jgi:hypothetical protein